ncbi:MAG: tetratricopeptide repeat protein [Alphaproteobacteria bacterium]
MTRTKRKYSLKSLLLLGTLIVATSGGLNTVMAGNAFAQSNEEAAAEGRQFGAKAGEMVLEAQNLMSANSFSPALAKLNEALAITDLNAYERSTIYQMQGAVYYELNNYPQSIQGFENAISAGGLLPKEVDNLRVNIAQLLIGNGQYAQGAQMLETWARNGGTLKPTHIEMLTQAWVQSENYSKALPWATRWFDGASPKERKHFDLLNFLYNNLKMPGKQADIVKEMIARWPDDKQLWDNWASLLANGGREQEAFEVNKMLYLGGVLKSEQDLLKVVQYYSFYDMPYQAANILERELNAGRIAMSPDRLVQLSDLFRQSREYDRAIPVLEKAAKQSGKAKLYADLGEALYNSGKCESAETAFKEAINRGYDAGKSWMLIATCRYEAAQAEEREVCSTSTKAQRAASSKNKKRNNAIAAFQQVPGASRESRNAKKWISFIKAEAKAVEDRCDFEDKVEEELCFIKIRQAYDAQVFTNSFNLDEECESFKPKFDSIYKQKIAQDGPN